MTRRSRDARGPRGGFSSRHVASAPLWSRRVHHWRFLEPDEHATLESCCWLGETARSTMMSARRVATRRPRSDTTHEVPVLRCRTYPNPIGRNRRGECDYLLRIAQLVQSLQLGEHAMAKW